jgi:hypothetical protein
VPDGRDAFSRWRALGRLLPREVRERIFEPAFSDLLYSWVTGTGTMNRRVPFAIRALGTYVGCVPVAVPRVFIRHGRLTRVGKATVWGLVTVAVAVWFLRRIGTAYANYP